GVKTDKTGIVGLHYYYSIDHEDAVVKSVIQNVYNDMGEFKPLPDEWTEEDIHHLKFILNQEADFGFLPFSNNNTSLVTLENKEYNLEIFSQTESDEHSWQLWHPAGASFTCIEPMSAKNPRGILPKEGRIRVKITIVPKE
ncbi:MAG: hypothetical protein K9M13_02135, partial [Simkaniaceae bacterium]|nr:hypothetical protein [Simkaniaceae bacterium]